LLARLRTRSLLAAPIHANDELQGFLSVEDHEARIWEEAEKRYVRAAAQLVALVTGKEEIEAAFQETQQDTQFAVEIAQAIAKCCHVSNKPYLIGNPPEESVSVATKAQPGFGKLGKPDLPETEGQTQFARSKDTTTALKNCARLLCDRLDAERFLLLQEDHDGRFTLVFGTQPLSQRSLTTPLAPLESDDRQLLSKSTEVVMIEDFNEDSRLTPWRESLSQLGVRSALLIPLEQSLLLDQTSPTNNWGKLSLLVIGHEAHRTWNPRARKLVSLVAQQINLLFTLGSYDHSARLSFERYQTLQTGLSVLSQGHQDPVLFEQAWLEYLAVLLECPLAALFSWTPKSPWATVGATVVSDPRFALPPDLSIPVAIDPLIQEVLATNRFHCRPLAAFGDTTRQWLSSPSIGQLLVIGLHTSLVPTTGILLLADNEERQWPQHLLPPLEILTTQFAWFRQYRYRLMKQGREGEDLQTLNWYKHQCLETLHQSVGESVRNLLELEAKIATGTGEVERLQPRNATETHPKPPAPRSQPLRQTRRQQLFRELETTLTLLTPVLKEEQWQVTKNLRPVLLRSLLKRSLNRVEPLSQQRQVVLQVHNPGKFSVYGDPLKLECILFELLVTSCFHAQSGSWINLWCCPISPESNSTALPDSSLPLLEVLIAEGSSLEDCLQTLALSSAKPLPSLNMKICQHLLHSWGGNLQFFQLDTNRHSLRLLLPLVH
jgi:hypothetical protein